MPNSNSSDNANTTTTSSQRNLLSALPIEIRHIIYAFTYTPTRYTTLTHNTTTPPRWLPSLCALNRATHLDVSLWYLSTTTIGIPLPSATTTLAYFSHFLNTFPDRTAWRAIRSFECEYFDLDLRGADHAQRSALWEFLGRCDRVRDVTLQFRVMNLLEAGVSCYDVVYANEAFENERLFGVGGGGMGLRSLEDVVAAFGIERLFGVGLGELRTVYLALWPTTMGGMGEEARGDAVRLTAMPLVEEIAEFLRDGFRRRGRDVRVVIRELAGLGMGWREI